jgi:hypothetical protein
MLITVSLLMFTYDMFDLSRLQLVVLRQILPLCIRTLRTILLGILVLCLTHQAITYDTIKYLLWFNVIWTPIVTMDMLVYAVLAVTVDSATWRKLLPNAYINALLRC